MSVGQVQDMHHCFETLVQQGAVSETLPGLQQNPLGLSLAVVQQPSPSLLAGAVYFFDFLLLTPCRLGRMLACQHVQAGSPGWSQGGDAGDSDGSRGWYNAPHPPIVSATPMDALPAPAWHRQRAQDAQPDLKACISRPSAL